MNIQDKYNPRVLLRNWLNKRTATEEMALEKVRRQLDLGLSRLKNNLDDLSPISPAGSQLENAID